MIFLSKLSPYRLAPYALNYFISSSSDLYSTPGLENDIKPFAKSFFW